MRKNTFKRERETDPGPSRAQMPNQSSAKYERHSCGSSGQSNNTKITLGLIRCIVAFNKRNTHLSPRLASPILPSFLEACVPVCTDDSVIESRPIDVSHGSFSVLSSVIPVQHEITRCFSFRGTTTGTVPKRNFWICSLVLVKGTIRTYSTKQKPQGVFLNLSSPIITLLTSPQRENNS